MKNIAVIFGGKSVEHDISIISAMQTIKGLKNYKIYPIYIKPDGKFYTGDNLCEAKTYLNFNKLAKNIKEVSFEFGTSQITIIKNNKIKDKIKIDCALLCNHGHGGEDGCLQGLLELAEIPYTSCNVPSSAICMDKVLTKIMLKTEKIKTPTYVHFNISQYKMQKREILNKICDKIGFPCIIKPANLGSSVGISISENEINLEKAIDEAFNYDRKIIVEKYIKNAREFCCGVMRVGNKVMPSNVQEVKKSKIYTFSEKYLTSHDEEESKFSQALDTQIKKLAVKAYNTLECDGVVRVDFLFDGKTLYINEVNSIPGSLAFNLFKLPIADFLNNLIEEGITKHQQNKTLIYTFSSQAIKAFIDMADHLKYKMN